MAPTTTYVRLNGVATKVVVFDDEARPQLLKRVEDDVVFDADKVVLFISGNPGDVGYYHYLMDKMHQELKVPVIGLSNSGHHLPQPDLPTPDVFENSDLYDVEGQTSHKATFIAKHIAPRTKLVMLGHSIGCYMILELIDKYPNVRTMVEHSILIFPAIDSLGAIPEGQKVRRLVDRFYYVLLALAYFMQTFTTESMKFWLLRKVFYNHIPNEGCKPIPEPVMRSALGVLTPAGFKAMICMALSEFNTVKDPNFELIESNSDRISILYGEADTWCPMDRCRRMMERFKDKDIDIRCCLGKIDHAFPKDVDDTLFIAKLCIEVIRKRWP